MPVPFHPLQSASGDAGRLVQRESPVRCQCGRCRGFFRAGSGDVPRTFGDWWACRPCSASQFPLEHDVNEHQQGPSSIINAVDTGTDNVVHEMIARPRRRVARHALGFIGVLGFAGLVVSGCGADPSDVLGALAPHGIAPSGGSAVNGLLDEWRVRADVDTVRAGPVSFTFENNGTQVHEMLITRTDIRPGQIPVDPATNRFNEDDPASKVLDEISELDPGKTGSVTLNLTPGTYQLVCNVAGHYTNGMSMTFTVTH